jgi:hypothetical protein
MNTLIYIGIGLLGVIAYCLVRANTLQQDANAGNVEFSFADYFKKDLFSILLSVVAVFIWVSIFEETVAKYPQIESYTRLSFAGVGFMGCYFLQLVFGKAKKFIRKQIDEKTNELDEMKNKL